jgi:hypothetical protein
MRLVSLYVMVFRSRMACDALTAWMTTGPGSAGGGVYAVGVSIA